MSDSSSSTKEPLRKGGVEDEGTDALPPLPGRKSIVDRGTDLAFDLTFASVTVIIAVTVGAFFWGFGLELIEWSWDQGQALWPGS